MTEYTLTEDINVGDQVMIVDGIHPSMKGLQGTVSGIRDKVVQVHLDMTDMDAGYEQGNVRVLVRSSTIEYHAPMYTLYVEPVNRERVVVGIFDDKESAVERKDSIDNKTDIEYWVKDDVNESEQPTGKRYTCSTCDGSGKTEPWPEEPQNDTCPDCDGTGKVNEFSYRMDKYGTKAALEWAKRVDFKK